MDRALFYFINNACSNRLLDLFFTWLTKLGEWEILSVVAVFLLLFCKTKEKLIGVHLLGGLFVAYWASLLLKILVVRPRPFMVLPYVNVLVHAGPFSFPSGHAINIFLAATLLSAFYKKPFYFYLIAVMVAFSRIYCGVHYPSDVIAGALIGYFLGKCVIWISVMIRRRDARLT
jgi:undecaprenyl-diphosphatase